MKNIIIQCQNISICYGTEMVIENTSFTIERGKLIPFVGPNGSGKTTLIKAIIGLKPVASGKIKLQSEDLPGYVPQQKHIDPIFPVSLRGIIEMGLSGKNGFWKKASETQKQKINKILQRFNLTEHQNKTFSQLSGGMRQKALITRALVGDPELLIMDEPTAGLDAASEADVLGHLKELNTKDGKTIILAHHSLEDLSCLTDTVCLIEHGKVKFVPAQKACDHLLHHRNRTIQGSNNA